MFSFACRAWKRRNVWRQRQNRNVDRLRMVLLWIKSSKTKACRIVARRPLLPHRLACGPWNKWAILNYVLGLRRSAGSICSMRDSCRTRFLVVTVVLNRWQKWIERRMDLWNAKILTVIFDRRWPGLEKYTLRCTVKFASILEGKDGIENVKFSFIPTTVLPYIILGVLLTF